MGQYLKFLLAFHEKMYVLYHDMGASDHYVPMIVELQKQVIEEIVELQYCKNCTCAGCKFTVV